MTMKDSALIARARKVVQRTLEGLPDPVRAAAREVPISYHNRSSGGILEGEDTDDIMGLFVGEAHGHTGSEINAVPAQILLFVDNIMDEAGGDPGRFDEEVRLTYLHELGHYLGWDEDEVEARGL